MKKDILEIMMMIAWAPILVGVFYGWFYVVLFCMAVGFTVGMISLIYQWAKEIFKIIRRKI